MAPERPVPLSSAAARLNTTATSRRGIALWRQRYGQTYWSVPRWAVTLGLGEVQFMVQAVHSGCAEQGDALPRDPAASNRELTRACK
jgi:hypothetical protein